MRFIKEYNEKVKEKEKEKGKEKEKEKEKALRNDVDGKDDKAGQHGYLLGVNQFMAITK